VKKRFAEKTTNITSEVIIMRLCTGVACCIPNIFDVMFLENINLSSNKMG
jgi:hypothetical protein